MRSLILHPFLLFFHITFSFPPPSENADTFTSASKDRWTLTDEILWCVQKNCIFTTKENIMFDIHPPYGNLQIDFRNNCYGKHCCKAQVGCTPYSTGRIFSSQSYDYGIFRWRSLVIQDVSYNSWQQDQSDMNVVSCFTVGNGEKDGFNPFRMSICVNSKHPYTGIVFLRARKYELTEYYSLGFDTSKVVSMYEIHYHPCHIKYVVNGVVLHEVKAHEIDIPSTRVRVQMGLYPDSTQKHRYPTPENQLKIHERPHVELRMWVYLFEYKKQSTRIPIIHDEPFILDDSNYSSLPFSVCIIIFVLVICCCILSIFYISKRSFSDNGGHYILVDDSHSYFRTMAEPGGDTNYYHVQITPSG